jgi:hypothetical protein
VHEDPYGGPLRATRSRVRSALCSASLGHFRGNGRSHRGGTNPASSAHLWLPDSDKTAESRHGRGSDLASRHAADVLLGGKKYRESPPANELSMCKSDANQSSESACEEHGQRCLGSRSEHGTGPRPTAPHPSNSAQDCCTDVRRKPSTDAERHRRLDRGTERTLTSSRPRRQSPPGSRHRLARKASAGGRQLKAA